MKLMILDGNSIVNRAFYGVRQLSAPDGTPTNAIFGFLNILRRLLDEKKPEALAVTFDVHAPTFRHRANADYKATRHPMPDELKVQMPLLKEVLDKMGIRCFEKEGYEADDLLGTAARICEEKGWECLVVTGDKDSLQLVSPLTTVCNVKTRMGQTETIDYTPARFEEEYGFEPIHMIDLKALMGDSSDNISGVPGIGEKTAMDLVQRYRSIDTIYADTAALEVKEGVRKKLIAGEESARTSYWLATIFREAPMALDPAECLWDRDYQPGLYDLFLRLGFVRVMKTWQISPDSAGTKKKAGTEAGSAEAEAENETPSATPAVEAIAVQDAAELLFLLNAAEYVAVSLPQGNLDRLELVLDGTLYSAERLTCTDYEDLLGMVFSADVKKVGHNIKDTMCLLLQEGRSTDGFVFDTALAAYLLDATRSDYEPDRLSVQYLGRACEGAMAIYALYPVLTQRMEELGMTELYRKAELPLCEVLASMEQAGFLVDRKALHDFGESLVSSIDLLQQSIWSYAGREFNINSPKQLGEVLFDELMLPYGKKTKTGWSTNADVLDKLRGKHPIVDEILEYRTLTKLKSTYADGLLKVIGADGRIHTKFQMTVTATGRLSSTEPNLQNIPIRKELGAKIREMFVAGEGKTLVDADYSQIELRLLAHMADDEVMLDAFASGEDFHRVTASHVFNLPLEEVTPLLRSRAKAVNFGIVYGISAFSLAQDIGVSNAEAKAYMDAYLERFRGVREYMSRVVEQAKEDGYVCTLYGRRRALPELKDSKFSVRQFGERVALNMPVQGTAADIIKIAMVNAYRALKAECPAAKLLLQVHDELIVECDEADAAQVKAVLTREMENAAQLRVRLLADAKEGKTWAKAH